MNKLFLAPTSLPQVEPLEFIAAAEQAGYDGVGLRLHRSPVYPSWFPIVGDAQLMRVVKSALASTGLELLDIFTFYFQPELDMDVMRQAMEFGAELGATYAQCIGDDPEWDRMRDNFGQFCDIAAGFNLTVAIEAPVNSRVVNKIPLALQLIADAGRANAGIVLDPGQFHRAGHSPDLLRGQPARLFPYTQLNDVLPDGGPRCAPGAGEVPLQAILDALPQDLPLSLEWSPPRDSSYTAIEWATYALAETRRFLAGYYTSRR